MKKEIKVIFEANKKLDINPIFASSTFIISIEKIEKKFNDIKIIITNNNYKEASDKIIYEVIINILYQIDCSKAISMISEIVNEIKRKYEKINIYMDELSQLKIRKAKKEELDILKTIALKIVKNMNINGLQLWNDYYPAEEFKGLIEQEKLYICEEKNNIVSFFALVDNDESSFNFKWKYDNSKFLEMFAVNIDYLHKKYAQRILYDLFEILKSDGYDSLKLIVYDQNIAAISLYNKVGFKIVPGNYVFINKFRPNEPPRNMIGMEYYMNK